MPLDSTPVTVVSASGSSSGRPRLDNHSEQSPLTLAASCPPEASQHHLPARAYQAGGRISISSVPREARLHSGQYMPVATQVRKPMLESMVVSGYTLWVADAIACAPVIISCEWSGSHRLLPVYRRAGSLGHRRWTNLAQRVSRTHRLPQPAAGIAR